MSGTDCFSSSVLALISIEVISPLLVVHVIVEPYGSETFQNNKHSHREPISQ
jgi:hypothetical protein